MNILFVSSGFYLYSNMSDRLHLRNRINCSLYRINMVEDDYD